MRSNTAMFLTVQPSFLNTNNDLHKTVYVRGFRLIYFTRFHSTLPNCESAS